MPRVKSPGTWTTRQPSSASSAPGASHGYDLKSRYDRWFGLKKPLAFGQVYTTLTRLMRNGWIVAIGAEAGRLLDLQRSRHMARMRELTNEKRGAGLAVVLACDHALFHIEADLRWIDLTAARLTRLQAEVKR